MKQIHLTTRSEWRQWLSENHDRHKEGIWLVFNKKSTSLPSLNYEDSVQEALCFGWIDSIIKSVDEGQYCRKFTPRKNNSVWSNSNKDRVGKLIQSGLMTEFGQAKVDVAKKSGRWELDPTPAISMEVPEELSSALKRNKGAKAFFNSLSASSRKQYIGWIVSAKRSDTRVKRVGESLALLAEGKKLGLK